MWPVAGTVAGRGGHLGLPDKTLQRARRYRTAVAVATLLHDLAGQEPAAALTFLAHATLDTSAAAMHQSLQSAPEVTTALAQADWALYDAVAGLTDSRQTAAQALLRDVSEALQADEYVVTLVPILTDAKQRAIRLLAGPPPPTHALFRQGGGCKATSEDHLAHRGHRTGGLAQCRGLGRVGGAFTGTAAAKPGVAPEPHLEPGA